MQIMEYISIMDKLNSCRSHRIDFDILNSAPIMVDCGVCKADFSRFVIKKQNDVNIIGIEPCKSNFNLLKDNKLLMSKFTKLYNAALVGNDSTSSVLFNEFPQFPDAGRGSVFNRHLTNAYPKLKFKAPIQYEVGCITLMKIFDKYNLQKVGMLKMDIEGMEYEVITKLREDIFEKILQMSIEVHADPIEGKTIEELSSDLIDKLSNFGFKTIWYPDEKEIYARR